MRLIKLGFKKKAYIGTAYFYTVPEQWSPIESPKVLGRLRRKYEHKAPSLKQQHELAKTLKASSRGLDFVSLPDFGYSSVGKMLGGPVPTSESMAHEIGHDRWKRTGNILGPNPPSKKLLKVELLSTIEGNKILEKPSLSNILAHETYREDAKLNPIGTNRPHSPHPTANAEKLKAYLASNRKTVYPDVLRTNNRLLNKLDKANQKGYNKWIDYYEGKDIALNRDYYKRQQETIPINTKRLNESIRQMPGYLRPEYVKQRKFLIKRTKAVHGRTAAKQLAHHIMGIEKIPITKFLRIMK